MLFGGTQSGQILAWKVSSESGTTTNPFQPAYSLEGHTHGVVCLTIGRNMLYSGSMDGVIKKWDCGTLQCLATVKGHSSAVMSLVCWDHYLVSGSLDGTIKAWGSTKEGGLEVSNLTAVLDAILWRVGAADCEMWNGHHHGFWKIASKLPRVVPIRARSGLVHDLGTQGVLALGGMSIPVTPNEEVRHDILFCSRDDNSVHQYELPSFQKKGKVFAKQEAQSIHIQDGNGGLFFIGDGIGLITVGKMA
ncbi:hypothetical protein TIFTF001_048860 [Ficus carica]|uniref:Uncharacterized protein n=1 Tax=Ficus carica TaxID=3494 RepID=A0AA88CLS7_FICCA|nr:hypothetical protein TIFTF001_048860 [Ficus carica]